MKSCFGEGLYCNNCPRTYWKRYMEVLNTALRNRLARMHAKKKCSGHTKSHFFCLVSSNSFLASWFLSFFLSFFLSVSLSFFHSFFLSYFQKPAFFLRFVLSKIAFLLLASIKYISAKVGNMPVTPATIRLIRLCNDERATEHPHSHFLPIKPYSGYDAHQP